MNEKQTDNTHFYAGAIIFGALFITWKLYPKVMHFWHVYHTRLLVAAALLIGFAVFVAIAILWNKYVEYSEDKAITENDGTAVLLGRDASGRQVYLKTDFRTSHAQVIGTTNAGKTESIILPWAVNDIKNGSGLLIVDGKSDMSFLNKLYAYTCKYGRQKDFHLFSLAHLEQSSTFNPLVGGSIEEVSERVTSSFPTENSYYKAVQFRWFNAIITLLLDSGRVPTFYLVYSLLSDRDVLKSWLVHYGNRTNRRDLQELIDLDPRDRREQISGLLAHLHQFAQGGPSILFNSENPGIKFDEALQNNSICYFQLPTMYYPSLAAATGRLVLQTFQNAIAKRHLGLTSKPQFFSCFLDDFQDYIYKDFGQLLNKSRSANIGVVFSHQSLGNLDNVSLAFKSDVITNTNIKVVMRTTEPASKEFYAKIFGTEASHKITEQQLKGALVTTKTGAGSVREVEAFRFHPNEIATLRLGEAVVSIPHPGGVKTKKIKLTMLPNLPAETLPTRTKVPPDENWLTPPSA